MKQVPEEKERTDNKRFMLTDVQVHQFSIMRMNVLTGVAAFLCPCGFAVPGTGGRSLCCSKTGLAWASYKVPTA